MASMNSDQKACPNVYPDKNAFSKLAHAAMPFGKYAGRRLVDPLKPSPPKPTSNGVPENAHLLHCTANLIVQPV
jgi:hypothetical protein